MKKRITEAQLRAIVAESVSRVLQESDMEEGFFKNAWNGMKGAGKGIANGFGNAVDNMKMNAYQGQMQGIEANNQKLQSQIQQLQQGKEQAMQDAANAKGKEIDQQIAALQAKMENTQGIQDKWSTAGERINARVRTGYLGQR